MAKPHHKRPRRPSERAHRPSGALARSLSALTVGTVQAQQAREAELAYTKLGEMEQQLQVPINGDVKSSITIAQANVHWPYPFVYAPGQRDSGLKNPQFAFGVEIVSGFGVIILPTVTGWARSAEGFFTGATVGIQAWFPNARKRLKFSAVLHATFTGYGAPQMDEADGSQASLPPSPPG